MEDITLYPAFLPKQLADFYLDELINWTDHWTKPSEKSKRLMSYFSDKGQDYLYTNINIKGYSFEDSFSLKLVKEFVENKLDIKLNSVLVNYYPDGRSEIRWHSDKEPQLGETPIIPCVNLGATRKFHFLEKSTGNKFFIEVKNGDLLVMGPNCQKNYLHAILKETDVKEPRISLTYRYVYGS